MYKHIITLGAAFMLIFAAGCQSKESSGERKAEPAKTEQSVQDEQGQAEQPAKEESPDQGTAKEEEPAKEEQDQAETEPADENAGTETEEPAQGDTGEEQPAQEETHYVSPFEMRDEISIGLTKEEAESVLQNTQPSEVTTEDGSKAFRYDYMPADGYKPAAADPDVEGIKAGKMEAQVFIYYTPENTVERFTIYHKTDDGKVIEYRDEGNGEGTESLIN